MIISVVEIITKAFKHLSTFKSELLWRFKKFYLAIISVKQMQPELILLQLHTNVSMY
jgi:hypothetical protein